MKRNPSEYAVVIKETHGYLLVNVPDLGISIQERLEVKSPEEIAMKIGLTILDVRRRIAQQLRDRERNGIPHPPPLPTSQIFARSRDETFTVGTAAEILGFSKDTVRRLIVAGRILATQTPGGHFRLDIKSVHAYRRSNSPGLEDEV